MTVLVSVDFKVYKNQDIKASETKKLYCFGDIAITETCLCPTNRSHYPENRTNYINSEQVKKEGRQIIKMKKETKKKKGTI